MKYPHFSSSQCAKKLVSLGYSHLQFHSEAKSLQVSLEYNHMDIQHVAASFQKQHNILFSSHMWFKPFIFRGSYIIQKMLHNKLANKLRPHKGINARRVLSADG